MYYNLLHAARESSFKLLKLLHLFYILFGLHFSSVPCLEIDTKRIMKLEISGAADIIFPCKMFSPFQEVKQGTQHPKIVAVCEV